MANELDAKRDIKLTASLVGGVLFVVLGGSYFMWGWLSASPPEQSRVDLSRVSVASHTKSVETPAYLELLGKYNDEGVTTAKAQNKSFIASLPMEQQAVVLPKPVETPLPTPKEPTSRRSSARSQDKTSGGTSKEETSKELETLLTKIRSGGESQNTSLAVAEVLGGSGGVGGSGSTSYASWSESLPGGAKSQATARNGSGAEPYSAVEVVPPYYRGAGVIDIGVDSDNSGTPVLAKLSGPYNGAVLKALNSKLAGDGVVIHFTEMSYKGVNYKVDAYSLQDDTLLANVATDVNHRYMSRIVLPAVLSGIGNISDMYSQANTQIVSNGFNTQTATEMPDSKAVAGVVLGGTAGQAAKVLSADAARTPATQVTVKQGQVVAIQFMRGVYAGDAIPLGRSGDDVLPAAPAQALATPTSQDTTQPQAPGQWRTQTQARIQAQRRSMQESQ